MSPDDVIHRFRLRVFALARELGNVRAACRQMGIHPSTYYRWAGNVETWGLEALRPRERRRPRMPNQLPAVGQAKLPVDPRSAVRLAAIPVDVAVPARRNVGVESHRRLRGMDGEVTVFISYAHEDRDLAQSIQDRLEREGFAIWIEVIRNVEARDHGGDVLARLVHVQQLHHRVAQCNGPVVRCAERPLRHGVPQHPPRTAA